MGPWTAKSCRTGAILSLRTKIYYTWWITNSYVAFKPQQRNWKPLAMRSEWLHCPCSSDHIYNYDPALNSHQKSQKPPTRHFENKTEKRKENLNFPSSKFPFLFSFSRRPNRSLNIWETERDESPDLAESKLLNEKVLSSVP